MNLIDLKRALTPEHVHFDVLPSHVAAFSALMIEEEREMLSSIAVQAASIKGQYMQSDSVASLGYALTGGVSGDHLIEAFRDRARQLGGRRFFVAGRAPRFEIDGIALLGVAAGLSVIEAPANERVWLLDLLMRSEEVLKKDDWQFGLSKAATALLTDKDMTAVRSSELRVALSYAFGMPTTQEDRQIAWETVATAIDEVDIARLAVGRAVFDCSLSALASLPVSGASIKELCALLENVSQSMSHWTFEAKPRVKGREIRQWHIDHEYHVQNLLWTVLKPVFADLVDEESLPKIGQKKPRFDLGVPSLHAIIEVKFMRTSGQAACAKVIDEVASDVSLYLKTGNTYNHVIAFIWDNCRQTEEYGVLIDGLEQIDGVEKVVILPRPSRMELSSAN